MTSITKTTVLSVMAQVQDGQSYTYGSASIGGKMYSDDKYHDRQHFDSVTGPMLSNLLPEEGRGYWSVQSRTEIWWYDQVTDDKYNDDKYDDKSCDDDCNDGNYYKYD